MKSKRKKCVFLVLVVLFVVVIAVLGKVLFDSMQKNKALDLVQNGYMGDFNMVTTKEVLDDYPRDQGTQKWEAEVEEINDEKRIVVKYSYNDRVCLTFLPDKQGETYKVYSIKGDDGEMIEPNLFSASIYTMYKNYMERHPEKGVNAIYDSGDLDVGRKGNLQKVENGELYDVDMESYLNELYFISTVEQLHLEETDTDDIFGDETAYESNQGNLYISLKDTNIFDDEDNIATVQMIVRGSRNMAPAFCGIRMGDDVNEAKEIMESKGFQMKSDNEVERRIKEMEFESDANDIVCIRYRENTGALYWLSYTKEVKLSELEQYGYEHAKFVSGEKVAESEKAEDTTDTEEKEELESQQEESSFIGMEGTYICTSSGEGGFTGKIEISNVTDTTFEYSLSALELSYSVLNGQAQIIDANTAQITEGGLTISLVWSDSENLHVTNSGFIGDWMDAATIDIVTDDKEYTRPLEFNQW